MKSPAERVQKLREAVAAVRAFRDAFEAADTDDLDDMFAEVCGEAGIYDPDEIACSVREVISVLIDGDLGVLCDGDLERLDEAGLAEVERRLWASRGRWKWHGEEQSKGAG